MRKIEQGHHVWRACSKSAVPRMYQKWTTFWRVEVWSNRLKDFGLNKGLENLDAVRQKLAAVTGRCAAFEAESLHAPIELPLFQRLALPIQLGRSRVPGIKIHDARVPRLGEVLLHGGTQITGWRSRQMQEAVWDACGRGEQTCTLGRLRRDPRKLKAHGLLERLGRGCCYRLTPKGIRVAVMFLLFRKRVRGPLAHSLFGTAPANMSKARGKIQTPYRQADTSVQRLVDLLAAACYPRAKSSESAG